MRATEFEATSITKQEVASIIAQEFKFTIELVALEKASQKS